MKKPEIEDLKPLVEKVLQLKNHMASTFTDMPQGDILRLAILAGLSDSFVNGMKHATNPIPKIDDPQFTARDMYAFAKFAKDYKSSPDVKKALEAFTNDYDKLLKKYT